MSFPPSCLCTCAAGAWDAIAFGRDGLAYNPLSSGRLEMRVGNRGAARGDSLDRGALVSLLLALGLLLQACGGGTSGSPRGEMGNPRADSGASRGDAAQREAGAAPAGGAGRPGQSSGEPAAAQAAAGDGTLSSSELALVYQLILDRYVDRVDHAALLQAANGAIRELELKGGALPLDTAPLDFAPTPVGNPERDWQNFARAYDAVVQKHPTWAATTRPDWAALRQMLASLGDNHSMFIEPDEVRRNAETNYSGIGVRMSKPQANEAPIVVEVFQNSPAAQAGLKAGDRVVAVDGNPTEGRPIAEVVAGVRGPQGTQVRLSIARTDQPSGDIAITRAPVEQARVEGLLRGNVIGIVRIRSFGEGVPELVQQVLTQGQARGARAWVLDLRGNPGGALGAVARVAANFIDNRPVGVAVDRAGAREPVNAAGRPAIPRTPLVVLTDKETASGAEILAAALKEYQIAPLVGTATAGSVGIAEQRPLSDGSAVQLTLRRLVTPSGAQLDRVGVQPDVPVDLTTADLERGDDPQLARALELLLGRI